MGSYGGKRHTRASRAVMAAMKQKPVPPGYHRMPDGRLMKGSTHKKPGAKR